MALSQELPTRFAKRVVRRAQLAAAEAVTTTTNGITREQTSSLDPFVVVAIVGGLLAVFVVFVLLGIILKLVNKPKSEARHQLYPSKGMFQPSAAGYGTAGLAARGPNESTHDVSSASVGLLDSAGPMGVGGRYEEGDSSLGSSNGAGDDFHRGQVGRGPSQAHAQGHGHVRGLSSGIDFPPPSAAFRRNASGQHPPLSAENSFDGHQASHAAAFGPMGTPDGSGFTPGQVFDHGAVMGGDIGHGAPPNGARPRQSSLMQPPSQRPYQRGPPPAVSRRRSGRYAQGSSDFSQRRSRIDSVGPGTYRKSMFLNDDDQTPDFNGGSQVRRMASRDRDGGSTLRRVDSVGKGDHRRTSRYQGGAGAGRIPSMINPDPRGGFGSGRGLPDDGFGAGQNTVNALMSRQGADWDASANARGPIPPRGPGAGGPLGPLGPSAQSDSQMAFGGLGHGASQVSGLPPMSSGFGPRAGGGGMYPNRPMQMAGGGGVRQLM
ncbi:hypothetical protein BCV70DRAFT_226924 [Testicularia cyperi]|uniref:Uncharacterized protein n=1 Tax=Testicularia cyperi TaxID=1882483 RepID=A0A317XQL7_9BASI|nr:hypothetical protein BCV70DRAFT_226924 [Testicularia cyperi]